MNEIGIFNDTRRECKKYAI